MLRAHECRRPHTELPAMCCSQVLGEETNAPTGGLNDDVPVGSGARRARHERELRGSLVRPSLS